MEIDQSVRQFKSTGKRIQLGVLVMEMPVFGEIKKNIGKIQVQCISFFNNTICSPGTGEGFGGVVSTSE